MSSYYSKKYSFKYPYREDNGMPMIMCTIGVPDLVEIYRARRGVLPQSFFDCGAAIGFLVMMADKMGLRANGIDVRRYSADHVFAPLTEPYFKNGNIKIQSILDVDAVRADLAYCNGTLTYMNETTLPLALNKFKSVGMLVAIHNTDEDIAAAAEMGDPIVHREPRLIRPNRWWMDTFNKNGFDVDFDTKHGCFCACPRTR